MSTVFWLENLQRRDHSEELDADLRIILEWILRKQGGKVWTGCIWLRIRTSGRFLEHGNGNTGLIKGVESLD
jgi:hypothetical protein